MTKERLNTVVSARLEQMGEALAKLADEAAVDVTTLFRKWEAGLTVAAGERLQWQDKLYRVVQGHTTQAGWEPDKTPALFTEIAKPGEEWPEWRQPTGAQDAYMKDAKCSHVSRHWISDVDNNVWEPGVYGWTEASE